MIFAASDDPTTASHKGAQNLLSTAVRARNCRISAGCPLSTSSARKLTMNRLPPEKLRTNSGGDG